MYPFVTIILLRHLLSKLLHIQYEFNCIFYLVSRRRKRLESIRVMINKECNMSTNFYTKFTIPFKYETVYRAYIKFPFACSGCESTAIYSMYRKFFWNVSYPRCTQFNTTWPLDLTLTEIFNSIDFRFYFIFLAKPQLYLNFFIPLRTMA